MWTIIYKLTLVILFILCFKCEATPVITTCQSISHNQSISITGSSFKTDTSASGVLWDTVENKYTLNNGDAVPKTVYPLINENELFYGSISSEQRSINSTACYRQYSTTRDAFRCGGIPTGTTDKIYVSWWWKSDLNVMFGDRVVCTFDDATDTVISAGHGYSNGHLVAFEGGVLPTNIVPMATSGFGTSYEVINKTDNTFQLKDGGTYLNLGSNGSGTTYMGANSHSSKFLRVSEEADFVNHTMSWTQMSFYTYNNPSYTGQVNGYYSGTVGQWTHHEVFIDNVNKTIKIYIDGVQFQSTLTWTGTQVFDYLWVIGFSSEGYLPPYPNMWMDDIYVSATWSRVMIGNASTFSSCSHTETQKIETWSDTSIGIQVNQGSFQNGDTAYLFVIDSDGNASDGFPITIGGTSLNTTGTLNYSGSLTME